MYNEITGQVLANKKSANGQAFARKIILPFGHMSESDVRNELRAIDKLCRSGHPNIVQVIDHGLLLPGMSFSYIDMELCDCSLEAYLNGVNVTSLRNWGSILRSGPDPESIGSCVVDILWDILNGLLFIHAHNEAHRDLCPSNGRLFIPTGPNCSVVFLEIPYVEDC